MDPLCWCRRHWKELCTTTITGSTRQGVCSADIAAATECWSCVCAAGQSTSWKELCSSSAAGTDELQPHERHWKERQLCCGCASACLPERPALSTTAFRKATGILPAAACWAHQVCSVPVMTPLSMSQLMAERLRLKLATGLPRTGPAMPVAYAASLAILGKKFAHMTMQPVLLGWCWLCPVVLWGT